MDKVDILLDVTNGGTTRCPDLNFLKAAEAAPQTAAEWTHQMDNLQQNYSSSRLENAWLLATESTKVTLLVLVAI